MPLRIIRTTAFWLFFASILAGQNVSVRPTTSGPDGGSQSPELRSSLGRVYELTKGKLTEFVVGVGRTMIVSREGGASLETPLGLEGNFRSLAVTSDARLAFFARQDPHELVVFDLLNMKLRERVKLPSAPGQLAVARSNIDLVVTLPSENRVLILNTASREIVYDISKQIDDWPLAVCTLSDDRRVAVAHAESDGVSIIDTASGRVVQKLTVGKKPVSFCSPVRDEIWVNLLDSKRPVILDAPPLPAPKAAVAKATEVAVLGMIHRGHRTSELWSLGQVADTVRRFKPDVLLVEIPPDRWEKAKKDFDERGVFEEPRTRVFPEYVDCLIHLAKELDIEIEPCAAWTVEMNDLRRTRMRTFNSDEAFIEARGKYRIDEAKAKLNRVAAYPDDDPHFIHSAEYDARTKKELRPYDQYMNDYIGPGGWTNINRSHYALVDAALTKHAGKRCLVTFGAGHKYWFLEQLRTRAATKLIDLKPFLPPRGEKADPEDRYPYLDARCAAEVVALHQFFQGWFRGELPNTDEAFSRFEKVLGPEFEIVSPSARTTSRAGTVKKLRAAHGIRKNPPAHFEIRNVRVKKLGPDLRIVSYEEWQRDGDAVCGIRSTAVVKADPKAPQGVSWLHVHETDLPLPKTEGK